MGGVDITLPGLGTRFLRALATGAYAGLAVGITVVVVVLVADDTDVTFVVFAVTLGVAAVFGGIGLILWLAAWVFTGISRSYVKIDAPLSEQRMILDRAVLGLGAAGAVACGLVSVVALAKGESLF